MATARATSQAMGILLTFLREDAAFWALAELMLNERHGRWPGPATGRDSDPRRASLLFPCSRAHEDPHPVHRPSAKGTIPHAAPAPSSGLPYIPHLPHTWPPTQLPSRTTARGSPGGSVSPSHVPPPDF